jgi:hypothetical protein
MLVKALVKIVARAGVADAAFRLWFRNFYRAAPQRKWPCAGSRRLPVGVGGPRALQKAAPEISTHGDALIAGCFYYGFMARELLWPAGRP